MSNMDDQPVLFCIGHHQNDRPLPVTADTLSRAHGANYDMVTSPVTTPHFHSRVLAMLSSSLADASRDSSSFVEGLKPMRISALSPADISLSPDDSMGQVIAVVSDWIDLCSADPMIYDLSRQILKLEVAYAAFCGIMHVIVPGPRIVDLESDKSGLLQFARAILESLAAGPFMQFHIWLPIIARSHLQDGKIGDLATFARPANMPQDIVSHQPIDTFGSWAAWEITRSFCKYHPRLSCALSIPKLLPPPAIQSRWFSEPVRLMMLNKETFSRNGKGYPALSKPHQALITQFARLKTPPWFLLCDVGNLPADAASQPNGVNLLKADAFPTLSEATRTLESAGREPGSYIAYMRFLQSKQPAKSLIEQFGAGYQDYLQAPLQPLTVNLESITYEVFEKDPIKYDWYERAIARALHDWIEQGKPTSGTDGRIVVAVVGAGRGPLVTRALRAADGVDVEVEIWALEKNPNAFVLLQRHNNTTWDHRVKLVQSDMRTWEGPLRDSVSAPQTGGLAAAEVGGSATQRASYTGDPSLDYSYLLATASPTDAPVRYKIDVLISELLGSFGDNELSPECIDGVQHLLNPTHGISIPSSYTAYLTPIAAPKLYADISTQSLSNPNAAETPYVVMLNAIDHISTLPSPVERSSEKPDYISNQQAIPVVQPTWSFHHPNRHIPSAPILDGVSQSRRTTTVSAPVLNDHNARFTCLTFPVPHRAACHGLAGYFETVLYGKVELSTNPNTMERKSEGMISWFPIYFPLKTPVYVPDNSELVISMWRQTDERKVWYEWIVDAYAVSLDLGDPSGKEKEGATKRRVRIGGSELHSSIKEGCLM